MVTRFEAARPWGEWEEMSDVTASHRCRGASKENTANCERGRTTYIGLTEELDTLQGMEMAATNEGKYMPLAKVCINSTSRW